jgi:hypothetical protein
LLVAIQWDLILDESANIERPGLGATQDHDSDFRGQIFEPQYIPDIGSLQIFYFRNVMNGSKSLVTKPSIQFSTSVIGVIIFAGLTAYDTQRLKTLYAALESDSEWQGKTAIMGALSLYLNFLNLFLNLLNFTKRKL